MRRGVNQGCWLLEIRGNLCYADMQNVGVLEYWSKGVLGLKAEIALVFTLLPMVMRDPNLVYIFPLYQPSINPLLHHSNSPGTINLLL